METKNFRVTYNGYDYRVEYFTRPAFLDADWFPCADKDNHYQKHNTFKAANNQLVHLIESNKRAVAKYYEVTEEQEESNGK